ncbi:helix-turn-helix transcriptional regulator [Burkholderia cepacia]|nr:helix-turn-helix transcriptional regulator [Burkholderia cepacia]
MRHRRTQAAVAERSGVPPRQVQRWEAGEGTMPVASWQLLCREWGTRFREDFATAPGLACASCRMTIGRSFESKQIGDSGKECRTAVPTGNMASILPAAR